MVTVSPSCSMADSTRAPLTNVPLMLRLSRISVPVPVVTSVAWWRDASTSGMTMSLSVARPILIEPGGSIGRSARPQDLQHARREVALAGAWCGRRPHRRHRLDRRLRREPGAETSAVEIPGLAHGCSWAAGRCGYRGCCGRRVTPRCRAGGCGCGRDAGGGLLLGQVPLGRFVDRDRRGRRPAGRSLVPADLETQLRTVGIADVDLHAVAGCRRSAPGGR